jgi:hypothetical protein
MRPAPACLALLLVTSACGDQGPGPKDEPPLPSLATVRALSTRECECRLAGRNSSVLAKEYTRLIASVDAHALEIASKPLSYRIVCLRKLGDNACFLTQAVVAVSEGDFVCTKSEAKDLEAAYARALPPDARGAGAANAALMQRLQEIREGLAAKLPQSACDQIRNGA